MAEQTKLSKDVSEEMKIALNPIKNVPKEIATVPTNATKADFERALGQVMMKVGKQQQIVNIETQRLQILQNAVNIVSIKIENYNG